MLVKIKLELEANSELSRAIKKLNISQDRIELSLYIGKGKKPINLIITKNIIDSIMVYVKDTMDPSRWILLGEAELAHVVNLEKGLHENLFIDVYSKEDSPDFKNVQRV